MERRIVEQESDVPYYALAAAALRGRGPLQMLWNGGRLLAGTVAALRLLGRLCPSVVLGTGGYVCVPLFLAARLRGIPSLLFLPDVVPGLAVRFLSQVATQVACSVSDSQSYFRKGLLVTGYPVRSSLTRLDRAACRRAFELEDDVPVVIIYGGSRGARAINRAVEALLPDMLACAQVIHVCGREGDEQWLRDAANRLDGTRRARYRLYPYLESSGEREPGGRGETVSRNMTAALVAADLAVCRSGASVLGELPVLGLPAILVPYPYVHQDENADFLVRHGAAVKVGNDGMMGKGDPRNGALFQQWTRLLQTHPQERLRMAEQSRALARPDAAHNLANALWRLATMRGEL